MPSVKDCTLENGHFLCKDGVTCLELSEYCNNHTGCMDGGDEGGLCSKLIINFYARVM